MCCEMTVDFQRTIWHFIPEDGTVHNDRCDNLKYYPYIRGRAIAQAVSRWLPTAAVRGSKPNLVMWDLWWDKVALGQRVLRFPLQSSFAPPITPQSPSCIIWGMYNRSMWPQCWDL
jgi:hypothetical protein